PGEAPESQVPAHEVEVRKGFAVPVDGQSLAVADLAVGLCRATEGRRGAGPSAKPRRVDHRSGCAVHAGLAIRLSLPAALESGHVRRSRGGRRDTALGSPLAW